MANPRIFISAVSGEFKTLRRLVAETITRLGYTPVSQEILGTESGDLRQVLRDKIDSCVGLIQIVGEAYGAEPPIADGELGRVSYTQYELLYARRQAGKGGKQTPKTWIIFAGDGCFRDHRIDELDLPTDPSHPDPAGYQRERRGLQAAYRAGLQRTGHLYHLAGSDAEVQLKIEQLRDDLSRLRLMEARSQRRWMTVLVSMLALVLAIVVLLVGLQRAQGKQVQEVHTSVVQEIRAGEQRVVLGEKTEADRVIREVGHKLDELPKRPQQKALRTAVDGVAVLSPKGLRRLGTTPLALSSIGGITVIVSQRSSEAVRVSVPAGATEDIAVDLTNAHLPQNGAPFRSSLLNETFAWVPAASVRMGGEVDEVGSSASERPLTTAAITHGFWMASHETTNEMASLLMERFGTVADSAPRQAAEGVSWQEAVTYCEELTRFDLEAHRIPEGYRYTLPTEAEWELACRAGTITRFYTGDDASAAEAAIWSRENSGLRAHAVGEKVPNGFGIYDMCGNVEEWCLDWFGPYRGGSQVDPVGPRSGNLRVARGGSWADLAVRSARSASRSQYPPDSQRAGLGFRIVLKQSNR